MNSEGRIISAKDNYPSLPNTLDRNVKRLGDALLKQLEKNYETHNESDFFIQVGRYKKETVDKLLALSYGNFYDHDLRRDGYVIDVSPDYKQLWVFYF